MHRTTITPESTNVLVVEDVDSNLLVAQEMLEEYGCNVDTARDGKTAINMLESNPHKYSLVLMDCQLPEMDGYEATRIIRNQPWCRTLSIVAITANAVVGDKEKYLEAGMDDYISKPMRLADIERIVDKYIKRLVA